MAATSTILPKEAVTIDRLRNEIDEIGLRVLTGYTLADAIREGSKVTDQAYNWGDGATACALSAGYLAAKARGLIAE